MKDSSIKALQASISDKVSSLTEGEPWICHIENHSNNLKWFEKTNNYHLNPKFISQLKEKRGN
jgi:hypothetical protein